MRPNISEFSYGYALTDELVHSGGSPIVGAPVFPSLYAEGQPGGGWDLRLNRPSVPLFLQFKLSDYMKSRGCREYKTGRFTSPCYRMHLRPLRHSEQHTLLLELEAKGHEVYYSAPAFHEPYELDDAYVNRQVRDRSLWLRPSYIGVLPDDGEHHVSFQIGGPMHLFSEPRQLEGSISFESFSERMRGRILQEGERLSKPDALNQLAEDVSNVLEERGVFESSKRRTIREELQTSHPLHRASYLAATFLECQMFMLSLAPSIKLDIDA